jgi:4a-hydroxytetrahydrobiopterin dehydratase
MTASLAARACTACRKGMPRLDRAAAEALAAEVPGWSLCENAGGEDARGEDARRIERHYRFADFATAFAFVRGVADIAEEAGHHPDIAFGWGYVRLSLHTHAIGGLHENDFILAARIDARLPL